MIKRVVGFTESALKEFLLNNFNYDDIVFYLKQHRILMSSELIECYKKVFEYCGELDVFQSWFTFFNATEWFEMPTSTSSTAFSSILKTQIEKYPHRIIVSFNETPPSAEAIFTTLSNLNKSGPQNVLEPYCLPYASVKQTTDKMRNFLDWLKEWLENEPKVTIIDPYAWTSSGNSSKDEILKDYYMPLIPPSSSVCVYYRVTEHNQVRISSLLARYPSCNTVAVNPEDIHDRYIVCTNFSIFLGSGLDAFDLNSKTFKRTTQISVSNAIPPFPHSYDRTRFGSLH